MGLMAEQGMEAQQELENQRQWELLLILTKLERAMQDGYINKTDMADIKREFGLSTMKRNEHEMAG